MGYAEIIRKIIGTVKGWFGRKSGDLQPSEILDQILTELEKRKKIGIDESPFVPNSYSVYLSPSDYDELSPLISGIKDQLKNRLVEKVKKKGYRLLSPSISIELRADGALQKSQVAVESAFLKHNVENTPVSAVKEVAPVRKPEELKSQKWFDQPKQAPVTRIAESPRTKIIELPRVNLEILDGEAKGEVISLKDGEYTFGRGTDAAILIKDSQETVSRLHFKLIVKDQRVRIRDLNSANGTKVNEKDIEDAELQKGDVVTAGKVLLRMA